MRALRLPVGAKRRGNPFPLEGNPPLFVIARRAQPDVAIRNPLFSAFPNATAKGERIATAASGLAMTKSDFFDSLNPDAVYPAPGLSFSANTIVAV